MIDDSLTSISREQWQRLADDLSAQRPSVGKRVRVSSGKKFLGRVGIVRSSVLSLRNYRSASPC
jgi:hypothetical protein